MFTSTKTHELGKPKIKGKMCSLAKKKEERVLSEEISERLGEVQVVVVRLPRVDAQVPPHPYA
jgi:hypothetical protein